MTLMTWFIKITSLYWIGYFSTFFIAKKSVIPIENDKAGDDIFLNYKSV